MPDDTELAWRVEDAAGGDTGEGTEALGDAETARFDAVCVHSPDGSPGGWVVIDDLVISR
jgi:hypothetical protein